MCRIQGHGPGEPIVESHGRRFARCARCGADLIESEGGWQTPPRGMRIAWAALDDGATGEDPTEQRSSDGERRKGEDRRKNRGAPLPGFLRGRERRSGQRDRRTAFGRRFTG
jgi:hypothetical protein